MLTIIIDTNFLMIPYQFHVDIFQEFKQMMEEPYELVIIDKTMDELKKLEEKGTPEERAAARFGFGLVERYKPRSIKTDKLLNVDQLIEEQVTGPQIAVATQDKELKEKILAKNGRLVIMRHKRYLELL